MGDFDGLVAAVTGGASGIGLATAELLAKRGARVACLDLNASQVPEPLTGITCDVTDDSSVRRAIDAVVDRFGQLDVLVNNAGIGAQGTVADNDDSEWHRVFDVNVVGVARVSRAALPYLKRRSHRRRHSRQLREPGDDGHAVDRPAAGQGGGPSSGAQGPRSPAANGPTRLAPGGCRGDRLPRLAGGRIEYRCRALRRRWHAELAGPPPHRLHLT